MKDFYDLAELDNGKIEYLLNLAGNLERQPQSRALEGKVLALLFLNPSLRTLTSFQASMTRLGGGTFVVSPEMSIHRLETRSGIVMDGSAAEHIREAVPVIASYADVVGIRALALCQDLNADLADTRFNELRALCDKPLINLESAIKHPCQALADWKTLNDLDVPANGGKLVFSWVYHPDALPLAVPADVIQMAARRGMNVTLLRPDDFAMPASIANDVREAATIGGGSYQETSDRDAAMEGAHALYAGSWMSTEGYGNRSVDQKARARYEDWRIGLDWFASSSPDCRFMHCLPARRGVEVDDEVLDSSRSVVIDQARNRMSIQVAILEDLLH